MKPDNRIDVLTVEHQQWLQHPMTKTFLHALDKYEEQLVNLVASNATDLNLSDIYVRQLAVQIKTTRTIHKIASNTEAFLHQAQ